MHSTPCCPQSRAIGMLLGRPSHRPRQALPVHSTRACAGAEMPRQMHRAWLRPSRPTLRLLPLPSPAQPQREGPLPLLLRLWPRPPSATPASPQVRTTQHLQVAQSQLCLAPCAGATTPTVVSWWTRVHHNACSTQRQWPAYPRTLCADPALLLPALCTTHAGLLAKSAGLAVSKGQTSAFANTMADAFAVSKRGAYVPQFTRSVAGAVAQGGAPATLAVGELMDTRGGVSCKVQQAKATTRTASACHPDRHQHLQLPAKQA